MKHIVIIIVIAITAIFTACTKKTPEIRQAEQIHEATKGAITATFTARETTAEAQVEADKKAALAAEDARHALALAEIQKKTPAATK